MHHRALKRLARVKSCVRACPTLDGALLLQYYQNDPNLWFPASEILSRAHLIQIYPNHCCNWWYGKVSFYKMLTPAYFQASILVSWRGGFSVPERSAPSWDSPHSFPCHFALCEPVARWHSARWVAARCLWALEVHSCCSTSRQKNGSCSKVSCKVFRKTNYKQLGSHQVTTCSQILKEQGSRCSRCSLLVLPPILCLQLCLSVGYRGTPKNWWWIVGHVTSFSRVPHVLNNPQGPPMSSFPMFIPFPEA